MKVEQSGFGLSYILAAAAAAAALFRRYKMTSCTRQARLLLRRLIILSRAMHELIETVPQSSNDVVFFCHS